MFLAAEVMGPVSDPRRMGPDFGGIFAVSRFFKSSTTPLRAAGSTKAKKRILLRAILKLEERR